jgi:hypothetical protein
MSSSGYRFPANTPVRFELHDVVVHLIVAKGVKVHVHDEEISNTADDLFTLGSSKHFGPV